MRDERSSFLVCSAVEKRFGSHRALRGVSITLARGECLALLGPSGCGKSTLLNIVTGMMRADGGIVVCEGETLDDPASGRFVPLRRRRFAMVFQDFSLWPHMTVEANIAFAPRLAGLSAAECGERVAGALRRVRMERFADRYPSQLSGGQQQRIAMARAIAASPRLLLLDEPLSALDAVLREELRDEIASLVRDLGITTLFVTHDQGEALAIADRVAVMRDGTIEQNGPGEEIYRRPVSEYAARFIGAANILPAPDGGLLAVRREDVRFEPRATDGSTASDSSTAVQAMAPPTRSALERLEAVSGSRISWSGRASACIYLGERYEITLSLDDGSTLRGYSECAIKVGTPLTAVVARDRLRVVPATKGSA